MIALSEERLRGVLAWIVIVLLAVPVGGALWLGVAVGHGVPQWASAPPAHDWYLGLDLRLAGLPIRGPAWRRVAAILDQFHLPWPGIRIRSGEVAFGLY